MLSNRIKQVLIDKINFKRPAERERTAVGQEVAYSDTDTDTDSDSDSDTGTATDTDTDSEKENKVMSTNKAYTDPAMSTNQAYTNPVMSTNKAYSHSVDTLEKKLPSKVYANIRVCMYKIITDEMYPFIMFLLYKSANNEMNFVKVEENVTGDELIAHVLNLFRKIFSDWEDVAIEYKGFVPDAVDDDTLTLVLKYSTSSKEPLQQGHYTASWWWLLPAEIINNQKVLNFPISIAVKNILLNHNKLFLLYDTAGKTYETPEVGYYGNYYKKIASVASLGLSRQGIYSSFGPYYYFSTYKHAMRNAFWNPSFKPMKVLEEYITVDERGRYTKGGIVKFALFAGHTKMLIGRTSDKPDASSISTELSEKNEFVKMMLKLRDSDGHWATEYNSIRIGSHDITLQEKPSVIHTDPMIALKEYEQQVPLEYYYVDTAQDILEENIEQAIII